MKTDLLILQSLFVASGILIIWLFCRVKPWLWVMRGRADHALRGSEPVEAAAAADRDAQARPRD